MYEPTKRLFDLTAAALGLLLLAPLLLAVAAGAWLGGLRPVLFRQRRAGRHGRLFDIVKFRSMTQQRDPDGQLLPDAQRLTALGRTLRRSSLDELPQLWNVLRGELSLIGPRPLLPEYLPLYSPTQAVRHEVRPGITGWAQVHGRNALSWEEKFRLDAWYVAHRGWALDLRILWLTLRHLLAREQPAGAHAPAERFRGSAEGTGED
jgi:lipopolysaccharide/colanic/teichoic acid biosynthesis glycosyltransferase